MGVDRIYPTSSVAFKFARFVYSWLQRVGSIAWESVQITHHWSEQTETATENRVGQAGSHLQSSLRQPFVSGVVDSSKSVMLVSYILSCNISHTLLSTRFKSGENIYIILQQIYSGNCMPIFIKIARVVWEILQEIFWSLFFRTQCTLFMQFAVHVPRRWTLRSWNASLGSRSVSSSMPRSLVADRYGLYAKLQIVNLNRKEIYAVYK